MEGALNARGGRSLGVTAWPRQASRGLSLGLGLPSPQPLVLLLPARPPPHSQARALPPPSSAFTSPTAPGEERGALRPRHHPNPGSRDCGAPGCQCRARPNSWGAELRKAGGGGLRARGTGCSSASHREKGTFTLLGLPREEWGCRAGGVAPSSFQPPKSEATALAAPRAQPVARAPPSAARRALQRPRRGSGRGRAGGRGAGDWGAAERDPAPCAPGTPRRVPTPPWHE